MRDGYTHGRVLRQHTAAEQVRPVALDGQCSTEDEQDPETSHGWQLSWERWDAASRLLAALKHPNRGWSAVVVGVGPLLVRRSHKMLMSVRAG